MVPANTAKSRREPIYGRASRRHQMHHDGAGWVKNRPHLSHLSSRLMPAPPVDATDGPMQTPECCQTDLPAGDRDGDGGA